MNIKKKNIIYNSNEKKYKTQMKSYFNKIINYIIEILKMEGNEWISQNTVGKEIQLDWNFIL